MSYTVWVCPQCNSKDLNVIGRSEYVLIQHDDGEFETVPYKHSNGVEWDRNSTMICQKCDHVELAGQFEQTIDDEPKLKVAWILWDDAEMQPVGRAYSDYDACVADAARTTCRIIKIEA